MFSLYYVVTIFSTLKKTEDAIYSVIDEFTIQLLLLFVVQSYRVANYIRTYSHTSGTLRPGHFSVRVVILFVYTKNFTFFVSFFPRLLRSQLQHVIT